MRRVWAAMVAALALGGAARAEVPEIVVEERMIASGDPGVEIYMREKRPKDMTAFSPSRTLLYVHGATYPAETSFDLPIEGVSMMDRFAREGFDVFLVDMRTYGRSSRPPEMDQPAEANAPLATSDEVARDISAAVDSVLKLRGIPKLDLLGWSWGTSISGRYAAAHSDKLNRLVLYAPIWALEKPLEPSGKALPAYRLVDRETAMKRWYNKVPEDKQAALIPPGVFDAWWNATLATDPVGSKANPPRLRASNGVLAEVYNTWLAGKPFYDPSTISVPTLIVHAEWDADTPSVMAHGLFAKLTGAPEKRFVEIGEGTHTVMLEKNRGQWFREVLSFLKEDGALAAK